MVLARYVKDGIIDYAINIDEEAMEWILNFSKVKWIREREIREIASERTRLRQLMRDLEELGTVVFYPGCIPECIIGFEICL